MREHRGTPGPWPGRTPDLMPNLNAPVLERVTVSGCDCFADAPPLPMGCAVCGHAPYAHGCTQLHTPDHDYQVPDGGLMAARLEARCTGSRPMPRLIQPELAAPAEVVTPIETVPPVPAPRCGGVPSAVHPETTAADLEAAPCAVQFLPMRCGPISHGATALCRADRLASRRPPAATAARIRHGFWQGRARNAPMARSVRDRGRSTTTARRPPRRFVPASSTGRSA